MLFFIDSLGDASQDEQSEPVKEESDANGITETEEALPAVPALEEVKEKEEVATPKRAQRARARGRNARL